MLFGSDVGANGREGFPPFRHKPGELAGRYIQIASGHLQRDMMGIFPPQLVCSPFIRAGFLLSLRATTRKPLDSLDSRRIGSRLPEMWRTIFFVLRGVSLGGRSESDGQLCITSKYQPFGDDWSKRTLVTLDDGL